jgi:hypothetical protein
MPRMQKYFKGLEKEKIVGTRNATKRGLNWVSVHKTD